MRTLVVHAHPVAESFNSALARAAIDQLEQIGTPTRVLDLYADEFEPALSLDEWNAHLAEPAAKPSLASYVDDLRWAERLVLIYPTWWSGVPAILKGWFDRVWMHGVAFELPAGATSITGSLDDLRAIDVVTTHGSGRIRNRVQGQGGRRMVLRGLRALAGWRCRTRWIAMYDLDRATDIQRQEFLERVRGLL